MIFWVTQSPQNMTHMTDTPHSPHTSQHHTHAPRHTTHTTQHTNMVEIKSATLVRAAAACAETTPRMLTFTPDVQASTYLSTSARIVPSSFVAQSATKHWRNTAYPGRLRNRISKSLGGWSVPRKCRLCGLARPPPASLCWSQGWWD